jgi:hypothetical protein
LLVAVVVVEPMVVAVVVVERFVMPLEFLYLAV